MQSNRPKPTTTHSLKNQIGIASAATFFMHPVRVALNRASFHISPLATIRDAYGYLFKGAAFNIIRGGASTGLQSYANDKTKAHVSDPILGKIAGLIAASIAGTFVATFIETPFMRKNASADLNFSRLYRFNVPITGFFLMREFGFSSAVLASADLSTSARYSMLIPATWLTAACHKLVMIEATKDLATHGYSVPDYSKGARVVLNKLATGAYTHPTLNVPIPNPTTFMQRAGNVAYATCGPNMFFFRMMYLAGFSEARLLIKGYVDEAVNKKSTCGK